MKRLLTLLAVSLALMMGSISETNAQGAHAKGDIFLNPGIGFGTWGLRGGGRTPVAIQFDAHFGVHDYVSVGPYFGLKFSPKDFLCLKHNSPPPIVCRRNKRTAP